MDPGIGRVQCLAVPKAGPEVGAFAALIVPELGFELDYEIGRVRCLAVPKAGLDQLTRAVVALLADLLLNLRLDQLTGAVVALLANLLLNLG